MNRLLLVSVLLLSCATPSSQTRPSDVAESGQVPISWEDLQGQLASGECRVDRRCGDLAFVNCRIEADGPGYYVNEPEQRILAVCGGACMLRAEGVCEDCPPPTWTCPE